MRPRERLLRRGIPNDAKEIRTALEKWSDRLTGIEEAFTAIVVLGLILEYLPVIMPVLVYVLPPLTLLSRIVRPHADQLTEMGGFLVIVGVAGELYIGNRSGRVETDLRNETNSHVAELQERAEAAKLETAKLKSPRFITASDRKTITDLLLPHAGKSVDIIVFDSHIDETTNFGLQMSSLFHAAKWKYRVLDAAPNTRRIPGTSVIIASAAGHAAEFEGIASGLEAALKRSEINCEVSPGIFGGCDKEFDPREYRLKTEEPQRFTGGIRLPSPFKIQIGEKQFIPSPIKKVYLRAGPKPE